jgi:hypothetical protein
MSVPRSRALLRKSWWKAGVVGFAVAGTMAYGSVQAFASPGPDTSHGSGIALSADYNHASAGGTAASAASQFTACMRTHGEPDFPGITILSNGTIQLNLGGAQIDPISAQYQKAAEDCAYLLPSGSSLPQPPKAPSVSGPAVSIGGDGTAFPAKPTAPSLPS